MKSIFSMMLAVAVVLFIIFAVGVTPSVDAGPSDTFVLYPISADPCQNTSKAKSSALISVGTNTTAEVVTLTANKSIYICNVSAYLSGTSTLTTFNLVSGTTTTYPCDTDVTIVMPTVGVTSAIGTNVNIGYGGTLFKAGSGLQLCSVTTGTDSAVAGVVTYVKQ